MPFFSGSSNPTISNSYLSEIRGDFFNLNLTTQESAACVTQLLGKRRERDGTESDIDGLRKRYRSSSRNSDGLMIMKSNEVKLRTELISRDSYRIHSASHGTQGSVVAVKVFEGPRAKEDWTRDVAFLKECLHSNVPKIVGISAKSSTVPFVVLHGISEKKIQSLIAKALRTNLNKSVELSMKAVKGLAAGLNYMCSQKISGALIDVRGWENFDIFAGDNDEPIIAIHPPSTLCEDTSSFPPRSSVVQNNDHGIEALNGLCQKLFSEVNSVLYDDSPQRELDAYDLPSASIQEVSEGTSNISEGSTTRISTPSNSTKKPKLNRTPRREVQWRLGLGASNRSLDSIARRFGSYLDCFLSSSSDPPLRRIRAPKEAYSRLWTSHRCPGYLREEITLTSDVSRSAIISHEYPSQSELCSVCGQLVDYQEPRYRENEVNAELMRIPSMLLLSLKQGMGLADKNLASLTLAEKIRLTVAFRNRFTSTPPPPPGNTNTSSFVTTRESLNGGLTATGRIPLVLPYNFEWQFAQVPHRPPSQTGPTQTPRTLPPPVNSTTMSLPSGLTAAGRVPLAQRGQHLPIHPQAWTPMAQYMMSKSSISSESPQPMPQDNRPRIIASSRRVKKDHTGSNQSKKASQSQHQQWRPLPVPSMSLPILSNASSSSSLRSHHQQQARDHHHLPSSHNNNTNSYPFEEWGNNYTRQEPQHTANNLNDMSTRLMAHMLGLDIPDVDPANSQGEREPNLDSHRRRRKQQQPQQQPMGYPYINNDTMPMWSNVPTAFEADDWDTYLSESQRGGDSDDGQMHSDDDTIPMWLNVPTAFEADDWAYLSELDSDDGQMHTDDDTIPM